MVERALVLPPKAAVRASRFLYTFRPHSLELTVPLLSTSNSSNKALRDAFFANARNSSQVRLSSPSASANENSLPMVERTSGLPPKCLAIASLLSCRFLPHSLALTPPLLSLSNISNKALRLDWSGYEASSASAFFANAKNSSQLSSPSPSASAVLNTLPMVARTVVPPPKAAASATRFLYTFLPHSLELTLPLLSSSNSRNKSLSAACFANAWNSSQLRESSPSVSATPNSFPMVERAVTSPPKCLTISSLLSCRFLPHSLASIWPLPSLSNMSNKALSDIWKVHGRAYWLI